MAGAERGLPAILPAGAVGAEVVEAPGEGLVAGLYAEELSAIADASEGRRREFAAGRACARRALELLGVALGPLPVGADGAPVWPDGVVGSITHKGDYRAAAVARSSDFAGLGIDAELDAPLPAGVLERIASPAEVCAVERLLSERPGAHWDRLLFSAKEATVKAAAPLGPGPVGLRAVEVRFAIDMRSFAGSVRFAGETKRREALVEGRWEWRPGLVVAAATASTGRARFSNR